MIELLKFSSEHLSNTFEWMQNQSLKDTFLLDKEITTESHLIWFKGLNRDSSQTLFAIIFDGVYVGNIGLKNMDYTNKNAEIWIYIGDQNFRGKGIAKHAIIKLEEIFAGEFIKFYARVADFNLPSIKSFQAANYNIEGILKNDVIFKKRTINILRFYKLL